MLDSETGDRCLQLDIPKQGMPVTIITGFLGSGKTTFLNHILNNCQGLKVAVLVNEFGDINIDSQLLVAAEQDMVELTNGCICCTINDSLVDSVYQVLERQDRIDYLVIETTGLADPLPILLTFVGTELRDLTRLDSVLGLVDAESFNPDSLDSSVFVNQLLYSDVILLNKTDLVLEEQLRGIEHRIHGLKDGARILRCSLENSLELPLSAILDVGLADPQTYPISEEKLSEHLVEDRFVSIPFRSNRPFDLTKFENFLRHQLSDNIFRAKGVLWFEGHGQRHIFQLVGKRCSVAVDTQQRPTQNQLVFIGRQIDPLQLHQQLTNCLAGKASALLRA
jgi:G3E family GTPase